MRDKRNTRNVMFTNVGELNREFCIKCTYNLWIIVVNYYGL